MARIDRHIGDTKPFNRVKPIARYRCHEWNATADIIESSKQLEKAMMANVVSERLNKRFNPYMAMMLPKMRLKVLVVE